MGQHLRIASADEAPRRTPERERLAEVIARRTALRADLAKLNEAAARALTMVGDARRRAEAAEAGLAEAKKAEAETLVSAFVAGDDAAMARVQKANDAIEKAAAELARAQKIRDAIGGEIRDLRSRDEMAKLSLDDAVRKVIATDPATRALLAEFKNQLRNMTDLRRAIEFIESSLPPDLRAWRSAEPWPELPGDAPWRAALAALEHEADALLPSLGSAQAAAVAIKAKT
jgi:chromosome segregation ATPase